MLEFIQYCIYCMLMCISCAFGNNPEGVTLVKIMIGLLTMIVLLALLLGTLWLISIPVRIIRKRQSQGKKDHHMLTD